VDAASAYDGALGEMQSETMRLVEKGFDSFVSSSHTLMSALDELSTAHPFVRGQPSPLLHLLNEASKQLVSSCILGVQSCH
jgi:hypothetical protein